MKLFKTILNTIKRLKYINSYRKELRLQSFRHFRRECRRAEQYALETGKRYRVYLFDRYRALSREDITRMKNYGIISKQQETGMYSKLVLYDTLTRSNTHPDFSNRKII